MIKELYVEGLNSKITETYQFNPDLNLLTGKNGSSKTTLLKLIWYANTGQFDNLIFEINFQFLRLSTEKATIEISRKKPDQITFKVNDAQPQIVPVRNIRLLDYRHPRMFKFINMIRELSVPTIFFPTFRRIEGGFSMNRNHEDRPFYGNSLKEAMNELSDRLTFANHKFIASISTDDIVQLLTAQFAEISDRANQMQKQQSDYIIEKIKNRKGDDATILTTIQTEFEATEKRRQELFKPFSVLAELIKKIFQHKGIKLSEILTVGEVSEAIASDTLSAGEKQMLSFLCYNTFTKNSVIFIDEPELSLHPDWQRTLVPTLLQQGNNNQFFMATHSPFIYSKYPDKEIILGQDKGDN